MVPDGYGTRTGVVEAFEEGYHCRFTAAGGAYEGGELAGPNGHGEIFKDQGLALGIMKADIVEVDSSVAVFGGVVFVIFVHLHGWLEGAQPEEVIRGAGGFGYSWST